MNKIIFSSWPYLSGKLHLGRLIGSFIPADCLKRLLTITTGKEVVHLSGLDCYGEKGLSNIELQIDIIRKEHLEIFRRLSIELTYGSTSEFQFKEFTTSNLIDLYNKGIIVKENIKVPYCDSCSIELRELLIDGKCKLCNSSKIQKEEERYIIKTKSKTTGYIKDFQEVERVASSPGLASPFSSGLKIWVWIEALHGYSYLLSKEHIDISKATSNDIFFYYGKDNQYFHKEILPLLNGNMPSTHYVSNYLLVENEKMSGSLNNFLTVDDFQEEEIPYLRLFLLSYNLRKKDCSFDNKAYLSFKKWAKEVPVEGSVDLDYANYLLSLYQKSNSFSTLVLELQKEFKNKEINWNNKLYTLMKILSPGILRHD